MPKAVKKILDFKRCKKKSTTMTGDYRDSEALKKLYWNEKKSTTEIGRIFGISHTAVLKSLKKFGIRTRSLHEAALISAKKRMKTIKYENLYHMYYEEKLSLAKIAETLGVASNTVLRRMIEYELPRRELSEIARKYPRKPFSRDNIEKHYMLGLRAGDLTVQKLYKTIEVYLTTTHPTMIQLFHEVFRKYGHCGKTPKRRRVSPNYTWELYAPLDETFEFLLKKPSSVPKDKLFYSFLAGYVDADGCWFIRKRKLQGMELRLSIITKDFEILKQIKERLEGQGYHPIFRPHAKGEERYIVCLGRQNEVISLAEKLLPYTRHGEKIEKIELILRAKKKGRRAWIFKKLEKTKKRIKEEVNNCIKQAEEEYKRRHIPLTS